MNNLSVLKDVEVVSWLLKNEDVIIKHFDIPEGVTPVKHLMTLQMVEVKKLPMTYSLPTLYSSQMSNCVCFAKLKIKKLIASTLFDDVLGICDVCVLTKYCKQCKFTYYPGYYENYSSGFRTYYPGWEDYPIFQSTHLTIISFDLMRRLVYMKQKCHLSFTGKADSFNLFHRNEISDASRFLDKRRILEAYFMYTYVAFMQRYQIEPIIIKGSVSDSIKENFSILYENFQTRYSLHTCETPGCKTCLVIDGNMKAHRKLCEYKGCCNDPKHSEVYCEEHVRERVIVDNNQELFDDNEFHVENITKKVIKKGKFYYEVKWLNHEESTLEPRNNIPRLLVELFELYGNVQVQHEITHYSESMVERSFKGGRKIKKQYKYVHVKVTQPNMIDHLCLPAQSLHISEEAYLIPSPDVTSCNTDKTKSRFYHRTGGVLVMAKPCGVIVAMTEILGGESVTQVAEVIECYLQDFMSSSIKCLLYDDACHLRKHVDCRSLVYPNLQNLTMKIDRFHFKYHTDSWSKNHMNPAHCHILDKVNTSVMEQIFAWVKGFTPSLRYMTSIHFKFMLLDMFDRHNMAIR